MESSDRAFTAEDIYEYLYRHQYLTLTVIKATAQSSQSFRLLFSLFSLTMTRKTKVLADEVII